jgi:hypothetical protein
MLLDGHGRPERVSSDPQEYRIESGFVLRRYLIVESRQRVRKALDDQRGSRPLKR